jgi:MYXO-CTERM domain-containing protein
VTVVDQSTGESEDVSLFQSLVAGQYVGGLASTSVAGSGDDNGIMSVAAGDVLVVTYIDAVAGDGSVNVARTDQITVAAAPAVSGGGGGGCSTGIGTGANPTMPALLLAILGLGWLRYHRRAMRG